MYLIISLGLTHCTDNIESVPVEFLLDSTALPTETAQLALLQD